FAFISVLAADAVLYLYSAAAIAAAIKDRKPLTTFACAIGLAFVVFAFYGSGWQSFKLSLYLLVAGGIVFLIRKPWTTPAPVVVAGEPVE
ncbi:MAG: hypothetical protein ACJ8EI_06990, partial [Sphingomicrobium sp.]